jgi:uncharacterized RDD family membrane protein YckC
VQTPAPKAPAEPRPVAGFWARYAAWSLDAACLLPLVALLCASKLAYAMADARVALQAIGGTLPGALGEALATLQAPADMARQLLADPAMAASVDRLESALGSLLFTPVLVYAVLALPWAVLFEQSRWQATPGKRALGLQVADARGRRLKAGHALLRHLGAGLSWLSLNLGHAMAALPPRHLALHDRISDTRVLRRPGPAGLPAWARGWIALQVITVLFAGGWAFVSLQAAMQAALEQALGQA